MSQWFAVHTHPRGEETARRHLERQGYRTYLPQYRKQRRHARKVDWVTAPLFPRYLFVAMDLKNKPWRSINGTVGVSWLVTQGPRPLPLPDGVMDAIRGRENGEGLIELEKLVPYDPGDSLRVLEGPFKDQTGLFAGLDDQERVVVLLDLMGREVNVPFPQADVDAAS